jgi:hypothetical protein
VNAAMVAHEDLASGYNSLGAEGFKVFLKPLRCCLNLEERNDTHGS